MRRIDRRTGAQDVDQDAPRPRGATERAGAGAVLADALARCECALAYRANVDAVLAMAALEAGAPTTSTTATLPWRSGHIWRRMIQAGARGRPTLGLGLTGR
jgi:hypothetical protein